MPLAPNTLPARAWQRSTRVSRLMFHWRSDELSLAALTGQVPTFARASIVGMVPDVHGRLRNPASAQPRFAMLDLDGDGVRETPGLLIEGARDNETLQTEDFGTTWAAVGSPTRVAAAHAASGITLDLIGDDDGAALEGYTQTVAFTGDGAKSVSWRVKAGTSTSSVIRLRQTSGAAADLLLGVLTWAAGLPVLTMTTGLYLTYVALADGVFELLFVAAAVAALETNSLQVYPATTAALAVANVGTLYANGPQCEDSASGPSSYIKTTTAAVSRAADVLSHATNCGPWDASSDDFTFYARMANPAARLNAGALDAHLGIGRLGAANPYLRLYFGNSAGAHNLVASIETGAGSFPSAAVAVSGTAVVEVAAQFAGLAAGGVCRADGGTGFGTDGSAAGAFTALGSEVLELGRVASGYELYGALTNFKIARGLYTMAQMRSAF